MEANGTSRHHRLQRLAGDRHRCHRIGYGIHEAAKAHGAKCQPGGVGEVIKPKTWVISTTNGEHVGGKIQDVRNRAAGDVGRRLNY